MGFVEHAKANTKPEPCQQGEPRKCHRHSWPETNVGPGLRVRRGSAARAARGLENAGETTTGTCQPHPRCSLVAATISPEGMPRRVRLGFAALLRPRAARAALPGQSPVLHLFRASFASGITWSALFVWLGTGGAPAFSFPRNQYPATPALRTPDERARTSAGGSA